jgi:hypothetical protein
VDHIELRCRSVTTDDLMKRSASAAELPISETSGASSSIVEALAPVTPEDEDSFQAGVEMRRAVLRNLAAAGRFVGPWESVRDQTFAQLTGSSVVPAKSPSTSSSSLGLYPLDVQSRARSPSPPQHVHAVARGQCLDPVRSEGSDSSLQGRQGSLTAGWG